MRWVSARSSLASYLAGATLARTGDEVSGPALLLFAAAATGSTGRASLVYGGLTVAAGVGGPVLGVLLDRARRPGTALAGAMLAYAAGLVTVAVLLGRWVAAP